MGLQETLEIRKELILEQAFHDDIASNPTKRILQLKAYVSGDLQYSDLLKKTKYGYILATRDDIQRYLKTYLIMLISK